MDTPMRTRLLAVLAADGAGYSRLMSIDDRATVVALDAARAIFNAEIAAHEGRVVDMAGDSVLAVFETATSAVQAARAIQGRLGAGQAPEERRLRFRLGVHVGDVIEKADGTVYGDGVNVASRLQALADPDGVAVSQAVQGIVAGRVEARFIDIGEQWVKNIARPVRVYRLLASGDDEAAARMPGARQEALTPLRFGAVEIRFAQRQLWVDAREVPLDARAFDMLSLLVEHRDRAVHRNELLEQVWQGTAANETGLLAQIATLRKHLGRKAIATVPGRGYQFTLTAGDMSAEPVVQVAPPARPAEAPVLPPAPGSMLGRDVDFAALERLLQQHRLVTLVGTGGIGKTTLALAAAHALQAQEPDGAAWVELAPLADPALLVGTVARALGVAAAGNNPQAAVVKALSPRRMLLVLDNAEHLIDAVAAWVQAVLNGAPGVRVLVTSQAALNIDGERLFRLGALAAPEPGTSVDEALSYGAVALFVDQAQAVDRHFRLTADNLSAVIDLCTRLDGVALAIKLAAARLPLFGLQGLQARLSERFRLLGHGPRSAPSRQQTLQAALDWSHGLLTAQEQIVFRRLGVFAASFPLDLAAKTACDETLDEWAVIEALGGLVDRSLVRLEGGDEARYRLLESARDYALGKLAGAAELPATNERAARALRQYFPARAEAEPQTLARHLEEGGCLLDAALEWERAAQQALARSAHVEAKRHFEKAIQLTRTLAAAADDPSDLQRKGLALQLRLGPLVMMTQGLGSGASEQLYEEALALSRSVGTASETFIATFNLWFVAEAQLRFDRAAQLIEASVHLARETGDDRFVLQAHHAGYTTASITGDWVQALHDTEEVYRRYRPVDGPFHRNTFAGHDPGLCSIGARAVLLVIVGRSEEAFAQLDLLQPMIRACPHPPSQIVGWYTSCLAYAMAREPRRMKAMADEALAISRRMSLQQYDGLFTVFAAWVSAMLDPDPGIHAALVAGIDKFESTGTRLRVSLLRAIAAEACGAVGLVDPGLALADQALRELLQRKELGWHAYTLIVRGNLLVMADRPEAAEANFAEALAVAKAQQARGVVLRAATALARLCQRRGRTAEVRQLVEPFLLELDSGFSTPDIDEARMLLRSDA